MKDTLYLLTGASGVLGTELQKHISCVSVDRRLLDLTNEDPNLSELFDFIYEQAKRKQTNNVEVIHCAAYTSVPGAENNKLCAIETNINGTKRLKNAFSSWAKVNYISTDYVYEGTSGNYKETDRTSPFNFYGFTKLAGEAYMDPEKDLVIRTSFKANRIWPYPKAFSDLYTSADYVDVIAKEIAFVIQANISGVINVGTHKKTIFDLARRNSPEILPMSVSEVDNVKMPRDISMNIDRLIALRDGGNIK